MRGHCDWEWQCLTVEWGLAWNLLDFVFPGQSDQAKSRVRPVPKPCKIKARSVTWTRPVVLYPRALDPISTTLWWVEPTGPGAVWLVGLQPQVSMGSPPPPPLGSKKKTRKKEEPPPPKKKNTHLNACRKKEEPPPKKPSEPWPGRYKQSGGGGVLSQITTDPFLYQDICD